MAKDFLPTASLECLQQRAVSLKKIRAFFDQRHFLEVETPLLSRDIVVDRYIQPISVSAKEVIGRWTSPSRRRSTTLAANFPRIWHETFAGRGAQAIYQITKAFRSGERGRLHNPEFTMLEWYRVGDDLQKGIGFVGELRHGNPPPKICSRLTYQQVFEQTVSVDPHSISNAGTP